MTLAEIETLDREILTPAQVAPLLSMDQQTFRLQARFRPDLIPFPVIVVKSRVKVPKRPFLNFMRTGDYRISEV